MSLTPPIVEPHQLTGECLRVKQAAEARSVRLPIARISIEGHFGVILTPVAVSRRLLPECPCLFSNRSNQLLLEMGLVFEHG